MNSSLIHYEAVSRAFSKQAEHFDVDDRANTILTAWRNQVYAHVDRYLKPGHSILELNSGTGIDAIRFAQRGHTVHATDISAGMVTQLEKKITEQSLPNITCQQLSFEELDKLSVTPADYIFSNFGGLNCSKDISTVTRHISPLLNPGGFVTFIIMPPVCLWEWLWFFKGHGKKAFRRLNKNGSITHLEGEYFKTYYYSLLDVKKAFGSGFSLISSEGMGALSPPPSKNNFPEDYPRLYKILEIMDRKLRHRFPFNRWADHIIVTFQKTG